MIDKSLAEFRAEVFEALALTCPFEMRRGQFVFNYVAKKYGQVASEVSLHIIDPFYSDDNIERFLLEVYNKLSKPSNLERIAKWDLERCRIYLLLYNAWRRGDENLEQPDPEVIGLVLDRTCEIIDPWTDFVTTKKCGCECNMEHSKVGDESNIFTERYVDLGLPSGTLWAECNINAYHPADNGTYYNALTLGRHFFWIPTVEQFKELMENTEHETIDDRFKNGLKLTSKINGSEIFLPYTDFEADGHEKGNKRGMYWVQIGKDELAIPILGIIEISHYFDGDYYIGGCHDWCDKYNSRFSHTVRTVVQ